jgi:hypothetical protein
MPWTSTTPILLWVVVFIPAFILLWIFPPRVKFTAILVFLSFLAATLYWLLAVNWSIVNYWLRIIPAFLPVLLAIRFWRSNRKYFNFALNRIAATPIWPEKKLLPLVVLGISILVFLVSFSADFLLLRSTSYSSYPGKPVLLFYPLRYGLYVVTNGGNGLDGIGMNNAYQDWLGRKTGEKSMAYAVDFMKIRNDRGWVSDGTLPATLPKYEGFAEQVFSPCVGKVVYVEDGHPDKVMGTPEAPLGNRVVMQCFEYYVTIANLRNGSIIVKEGESISYQVQIGQTGSSGTPSIPHVRIFTTLKSWDQNGVPVPQLFDLGFRFHVRNDLILPNY